jgi:FtsZ-binding cell division protein ZapB
MLRMTRESLTKEDAKLTETNAALKKEHDALSQENEAVDKELGLIIQRIDIATLLQSVDLEEMKILAANNKSMSEAFQGVMSQWDMITRKY